MTETLQKLFSLNGDLLMSYDTTSHEYRALLNERKRIESAFSEEISELFIKHPFDPVAIEIAYTTLIGILGTRLNTELELVESPPGSDLLQEIYYSGGQLVYVPPELTQLKKGSDFRHLLPLNSTDMTSQFLDHTDDVLDREYDQFGWLALYSPSLHACQMRTSREKKTIKETREKTTLTTDLIARAQRSILGYQEPFQNIYIDSGTFLSNLSPSAPSHRQNVCFATTQVSSLNSECVTISGVEVLGRGRNKTNMYVNEVRRLTPR